MTLLADKRSLKLRLQAALHIRFGRCEKAAGGPSENWRHI